MIHIKSLSLAIDVDNGSVILTATGSLGQNELEKVRESLKKERVLHSKDKRNGVDVILIHMAKHHK